MPSQLENILTDYAQYLTDHGHRKPCHHRHVKDQLRLLGRIFTGCDWQRLTEIDVAHFETCLAQSPNWSARTKQIYRAALGNFCAWCAAGSQVNVKNLPPF